MSKAKRTKKQARKSPKASPAPAKPAAPAKGHGGCLDAAAQLLAAAKGPMRCKELVDSMLAKGLWTSGGKTPAATLYSAILREIRGKGKASRFKKTDRGLFASNA